METVREEEQPEIVYPLKRIWKLWTHSYNNDSWSIDDYHIFNDIKTIKDFWSIYNSIPYFTGAMFFLMKDGIPPIWEDKTNINGGNWSWKIEKHKTDNIFSEFSIGLVSESLFNNMDHINGISINSQWNSTIIKIWVNSKIDITLNPSWSGIDNIRTSQLRYKSHKK